MVISQIWTQGFSSRWKTLDQSAGSSSCIDTDNYVIHSFVCLFFLSLFRSFVRLFPLSAVRLFFFVQCFACPLLPIVYSKMVSLYMSWSWIPEKFFFFYFDRPLFPWSSINELSLLNSPPIARQHMMAIQLQKQTDIFLAYKCFPARNIYQKKFFVMRLFRHAHVVVVSFRQCFGNYFFALLRSQLVSRLVLLMLFTFVT